MKRCLLLCILVAGCGAEPAQQTAETHAGKTIPVAQTVSNDDAVANNGYVAGVSLTDLYRSELGMPYEAICDLLGGAGKPIEGHQQLELLNRDGDDPDCKYFKWWDENTSITLAFLTGQLQRYSEKIGE
jgi:hypothetical protein